MVDRCMVSLRILHCCMAIGRLQVAFIETRLADLPKENTDAGQRALYRARTGVKLGATGAPDGKEARALFLRMSPRPWPMHAAWGLGWVPCARMSFTASTPSLSAHTMTTRAGRGGRRGQPK